jgi:transposase
MEMDKFKSFIGIDLHKTTLTVGCLDANKEIQGVKAIDTKCVNKIVDYIKSFPGPIACAVESVGMYEWLWELLEDEVDYLVLADAFGVKQMRKRGKAKTDRNDALLLARLLLIDEVPESYVPDKVYRSLRKLGRHYHTMSEIPPPQRLASIERTRFHLTDQTVREVFPHTAFPLNFT